MKKSRHDIEDLISISTGNLSLLSERGYHKIVRKVYVNNMMVRQDVFPIELKAEKGAYTYDVSFKGIGEFYNSPDGKTGRLIGASNSVAATSKPATKFTGEYSCAYTIDCPGCRVDRGPGDPIDVPGKPRQIPWTLTETEVKGCKGCVVPWVRYGENDGDPIIRQISLNNVNPTDRGLGYNLLNTKGIEAVKEIEKQGEEAYKTEVYSITLTPSVINAINDYVKTSKSGNISVNSALDKCKNYSKSEYATAKSKKVVGEYDYLICESGLLDKLEQNKDAKVKDNLGYTSWIDSEYCSGNSCVIGAGFGYGNIFGPAYK
jgi:hypothetical protein